MTAAGESQTGATQKHKAAKKAVKPHAATAGAKPADRKARVSSTKAVVLKSKVSFKGRVFSVTTDTVTEPGGVTSTRDVIRHNGSVVILAVDRSQNAADPLLLLERQYRHAAGKFLLELPAGRMEPGEAALAAAKRELIEETGYRAKRWSRLVRYFASPGFLSEHMQVFLAEDIRSGLAEPEEDEKIELLSIPLSQVLADIHAGRIEDGKTILSVLLFASGEGK